MKFQDLPLIDKKGNLFFQNKKNDFILCDEALAEPHLMRNSIKGLQYAYYIKI